MIPKKINGPSYVACEGGGDAEFIRRLTAFHNLQGFDVGDAEGRNNLERHLTAVMTQTDKDKIQNLIIILDNEDNPTEAVAIAIAACASIGYAITQPDLSTQTDRRVAAFMVPAPGVSGGIEHLILAAVFAERPNLRQCVDAFADCISYSPHWPHNSQGKMMLQCLLSAHCQDNPGTTLSHAWDSDRVWHPDGQHLVPLGSNVFTPLLDFLGQFAV